MKKDHWTKLKIDPFEYSMANNLDAIQHSVVKYVTRFRDKNGIEDLEKAKDCINRLIEWEYKQRPPELQVSTGCRPVGIIEKTMAPF